ncbi:MAG: tetratricopeptide repeat protein [Pseudomonadota bacterium]
MYLANRLAALFCVLLIASLSLPAAAAGPRTALAAGIEHFRNGELEAAREAFENAKAAGLDSNSLHYNLGVVYYRLGRYEHAADAFSALLTTRDRSLAQYNLGLVAIATGDIQAAENWLTSAAEGSSDEIRSLARARLQKLDARQASPPVPFMAYLSLAGGYDDNIASVPESGSTGLEGGFAELLAAGSVDVYEAGTASYRLEGAAYTRQYPSQSAFDSELLQVGASWLKPLGPGRASATVGVSQSWFDAAALERTYRLDASYDVDSCPLIDGASRCQAQVSTGIVEGGDGFTAYDGHWYQARLKARRNLARWRFDGQYRWEFNRRRDLEAGEQFVSVSPQRHLVEVTARYNISRLWQAGLEGGIRYSRYADAHRLFAGTELETARRKDQRREAAVLTEYALTPRWSLVGEWVFTDNKSTLERYEYRRHTAWVGVQGIF